MVVSNAGELRSITSSNSNEEVLVIVMVEAGDGEADVDFDDACSQGQGSIPEVSAMMGSTASDGCGLQNILALSSS